MTNDRIDPELTTVRHIERVTENVIAAAARLPSSTLHEAAGKIGALPSAIKPVAPSFRISGPAVTVHSPPGDNLWLHRALYVARPGDILVVYVGGKFEHGYWGEIMSTAARKQGLGGLVIDGCVRDSELLPTVGFPIFARGLCIRGTGKDFSARGWINAPVLIGDVTVSAGDLIVGDGDGVVSIPRASAASVVDGGRHREVEEQQIIQRIEAGESTLGIYGWN